MLYTVQDISRLKFKGKSIRNTSFTCVQVKTALNTSCTTPPRPSPHPPTQNFKWSTNPVSISTKFQMITCNRFPYSTLLGIFLPPQSELHVQPILSPGFNKAKQMTSKN